MKLHEINELEKTAIPLHNPISQFLTSITFGGLNGAARGALHGLAAGPVGAALGAGVGAASGPLGQVLNRTIEARGLAGRVAKGSKLQHTEKLLLDWLKQSEKQRPGKHEPQLANSQKESAAPKTWHQALGYPKYRQEEVDFPPSAAEEVQKIGVIDGVS